MRSKSTTMATKSFTVAGLVTLLMAVTSASSAECPNEVVTVEGFSNTIKSPGYPNGNYSNNVECLWSIQVPEGYSVELSFLPGFSLQGGTSCPYDYVEVRNGPNVTYPLLGKFCGDLAPFSIHAAGRHIFVRFKSDSYFGSKGFQASFRSIQPACAGTAELTSLFGAITSPNYPRNYHYNDVCTWLISVPFGYVRLVFEVFSTAGSCDNDYLVVRDGARKDSTLKGTFCGSTVPPVLHSSGRSLWIQFMTDSKETSKGFSGSYSSKKVPYEYIREKGENGTIKSPGFSSFYPNTEEYRWSVEVPNGLIMLSFLYFDLEESASCSKDYLEIRDGPDSYSPVITKVCGAKKPADVYSSGKHLSLIFKSDQFVFSKGFKIKYKKVLKAIIAHKPSKRDFDRSEGLIAGIFCGGAAAIVVCFGCVFYFLERIARQFVWSISCSLFALSIPMIVVGAVFRNDCNMEDNIPLYLVVSGSVLLGFSFSMGHYYSKDDKKVVLYIADLFFLLFNIAFLVTGSVWVFSNYPPDYDNSNQYCHKTLYVFAFAFILIQYFFFAGIILFLIILQSMDKVSWCGL